MGLHATLSLTYAVGIAHFSCFLYTCSIPSLPHPKLSFKNDTIHSIPLHCPELGFHAGLDLLQLDLHRAEVLCTKPWAAARLGFCPSEDRGRVGVSGQSGSKPLAATASSSIWIQSEVIVDGSPESWNVRAKERAPRLYASVGARAHKGSPLQGIWRMHHKHVKTIPALWFLYISRRTAHSGCLLQYTVCTCFLCRRCTYRYIAPSNSFH